MVVALLGRTDKRPILYPLMKLFQTLGDCAVFTPNLHTKRLTDSGTTMGHFQNVFIAVSEATPDEIFAEVGYTPRDFENIIFDCDAHVPDNADLYIYVGGAGPIPEDDEINLEVIANYKVINLGFGEKCIPYTIEMFKSVEQTEGLRHFMPYHPQIVQRLATFLTEPLKLPVKNIVKVVCSK